MGCTVLEGGLNLGHAGANQMLIQQTAPGNAILSCDSFSIGRDAGVRFQLNDPSVSVLTRVTGADPSLIYGQLESSGNLILVNRNGISLGPTARVNVGNLIASTLDVLDDDFRNGTDRLLFSNSGGSFGEVINQGSLEAAGGGVTLIGARVVNDGTLKAPQGSVGMVAASQVELRDFSGPALAQISVLADVPAGATTPLVENTRHGVIEAVRAQLEACAGNIFALAINTEGVMKARTSADFASLFKARASTATAGATPGQVQVNTTVERVGTPQPAKVDVEVEGGDVTIGGVFLTGEAGQLEVRASGAIGQSGAVMVEGSTNLSAGGNITLESWDPVSADGNYFKGGVQVAGAQAVSLVAKDTLTFSGESVSLKAVAGRGDLTVAGYTTTGGAELSAGGQISQSGAVDFGGPTTLSAGTGQAITLNNADNDFGGPVTVVRGGAVTLTDKNSLTVGGSSASLTAEAKDGDLTLAGYTTTGDLTAQARRNVKVTAAVNVGGKGRLTAEAGDITQTTTGPVDFKEVTSISAGGKVDLLHPYNRVGNADRLNVQRNAEGRYAVEGMGGTSVFLGFDSMTFLLPERYSAGDLPRYAQRSEAPPWILPPVPLEVGVAASVGGADLRRARDHTNWAEIDMPHLLYLCPPLRSADVPLIRP